MLEIPTFHIISFKRRVGKTALLERVIASLKARGFRVIAVKHTIHEQLDLKDRDTYRLRRAGAEYVIAISKRDVAVLMNAREFENVLRELGVDRGIILIEGFKSGPGYKLLVVNKENELELGKVENLIALLVKEHGIVKERINGIKVLDYYDTDQVVDFIVNVALNHIIAKLPKLNCRMCGRSTCSDFALDFLKGKVSFRDCRHLTSRSIRLIVNGKEVPLSLYPSSVFRKVVLALISTLKGVPEKPRHVKLEIDEAQ